MRATRVCSVPRAPCPVPLTEETEAGSSRASGRALGAAGLERVRGGPRQGHVFPGLGLAPRGELGELDPNVKDLDVETNVRVTGGCVCSRMDVSLDFSDK